MTSATPVQSAAPDAVLRELYRLVEDLTTEIENLTCEIENDLSMEEEAKAIVPRDRLFRLRIDIIERMLVIPAIGFRGAQAKANALVTLWDYEGGAKRPGVKTTDAKLLTSLLEDLQAIGDDE
jgi:hypothetical protein